MREITGKRLAGIKFIVPGKPKSWKRVKMGWHGRHYNPSQKDEEIVKFYGFAAKTAHKVSISGGYFRLEVISYGANSRSDWDNIGKLVSDALNGVFWHDDKQVVDGRVQKLPCPKGQERTEITVEELPELN